MAIRAAMFDLGVLACHENGVVRACHDVGAITLKYLIGVQHYKLGVITSAPKELTDKIVQVVENTAIVRFHSKISRAHLNLPGKPDPAAHNLCKEELGIKDWEAFYVGDDLDNLAAAKSAKIYGVFMDREGNVQDSNQYLTVHSLWELNVLERRL